MRIGPLELLVIGVIAVILLLMLFTARDSRAVNVELSETFGDPFDKARLWKFKCPSAL